MSQEENKKMVFYVEDEPDLIDLCKIAFQVSGIDMKNASTGEDAMKYIKDILDKKEKAPNGFIFDILLPGISGMDLLREVRKHKEFDKTPVIMFTNYSDNKIKDEVKITPNTDYILKTDIIPTQLAKIVYKKME